MTTDPQNEIFDVVDANDNVIGEATRAQVHQDKNLIHRVVHVWIINDKGEILLQQRSLTKDSSPGMWDISCGGHIQKGDTAQVTVFRELQEELNVATDFMFIKKYLEKLETQTEIIYLYCALHNGPFKYPVAEVAQVKFFSRKDALKFIRNDPLASFFSIKEIPMVFEYLDGNNR